MILKLFSSLSSRLMLQPSVKTSCSETPSGAHDFLQPSPPNAPASLKPHSGDLEFNNDTIIMGHLDDETVHEHDVIVE